VMLLYGGGAGRVVGHFEIKLICGKGDGTS